MQKQVTSITGSFIWNVTGPFNMDSHECLPRYFDLGLINSPNDTKYNTNYQPCKGDIYYLEDGTPYFLPHISADCVRENVFEKCMKSNDLSKYHPITQATALATESLIARGYMITSRKKEGKTYKRKSPFFISDVKPVNDVTERGKEIIEEYEDLNKKLVKMPPIMKRMFELCSTKGDRDSTSLHKRETFQPADYYGNYMFNIEGLEFLTGEDKLNDPEIPFLDNKEYLDIYLENFQRNFNLDKLPEIKPYMLKTDCVGEGNCERGILLTNNMVKQLIKYCLNLLFIRHVPHRTYGTQVTFRAMKITIHYDDGTKDNFNINNSSDIDNCIDNLEFYQFYKEVDYSFLDKKIKYIEKLAKEAEERKKEEDKKGKKGKKSNNCEDNNE